MGRSGHCLNKPNHNIAICDQPVLKQGSSYDHL